MEAQLAQRGKPLVARLLESAFFFSGRSIWCIRGRCHASRLFVSSLLNQGIPRKA